MKYIAEQWLEISFISSWHPPNCRQYSTMTKIFSKKITLAPKLRNRSQNSFLQLRLLKIILAPPALAPQYWFIVYSSVAELPLFWDAPAPDGQGPGADSRSGSDLLGSAPAPSKKRWLRLFILKFFILSFQKVNY